MSTIKQRTERERTAYVDGFDAGAKSVLKAIRKGDPLERAKADHERLMGILRGETAGGDAA